MRYYIEMYNDPPALRLLTAAAPLAGSFMGPWWDDPYSQESFDNEGQNGWYHNPYDEEQFAARSLGIGLLDNLHDYDENRR